MATKYKVSTGDLLSLWISTSKDEKCIPVDKRYSKELTVKEVKNKLEITTGASSETMVIKVYDSEDKFVCVLDNDESLLGSYHIDDGMRLHIEDSFEFRKALEDESDIEKYTMSPEEYEKRDENAVNRKIQSSASKESLSGVSRGRGHKNNVERLNSLDIKPPRRPTVQLNVLMQGDCIKQNDDAAAISSSSSSTVCQNIQNVSDSLSSLLLKTDKENNDVNNEITVDINGKENNLNTNLNPDAKEFVPYSLKQDDQQITPRKSEIEIIDPNTGEHVTLTDLMSRDDAIYGTDEFSDDSEFQVDKLIEEVSYTALLTDNSEGHDVRYKQEVSDVLSSVENLLTHNPGLFSSIISALNRIFYRWAGFSNTLEVVASKILCQSISTNTFTYFGAKICTALDKITVTTGRCPPFRSFILDECESVFEILQDSLINNKQKAYNIIMFFAELYIQLEVKGQRIQSLGAGLISSLNYLLDDPNTMNICCLCKILKLSGWALSEDQYECVKPLVDKLIELKSMGGHDSQTFNMMNGVINLASSSWGRSASSNNNNNSMTATPGIVSSHHGSNLFSNYSHTYDKDFGKVYGPDGAVLTEEENQFLNDSCKLQMEYDDQEEYNGIDFEDGGVSDDMDEEACEAYEEFLSMVPNSNHILNDIKK
ncbi:uncharacterized protein LOC142327632 [Lycorma delicatula]|uniref:uncharacterized protein LOC142327632 n=1 Tax=Lycorma delicatula TaxID=130591 RepID=UPI003F515288